MRGAGLGAGRLLRLAAALALLLAALAAAPASGQPGSGPDPLRVKVALVAKCLQYVSWAQTAKAGEVRIGLLGADQATAEVFGEMARNVTLEGKPVRVVRLAGMGDLKGLDVLYADESFAHRGPELWRAVERKRIFLVTDRFPDKKYVMLNLALDTSRSKLTFEVNRANSALEGFTVNPELLVLGGSEIDVRALYRKLRDDLIRQEETVRRKQALLDRMQARVDSMDRKVEKSAADMKRMEGAILATERRIAGQESTQTRLASEIALKSRELDRQFRVLDSQKVEIQAKQGDIARMRDAIAGLSSELAGKERVIGESRERIDTQAAELQRQGTRLAAQRTLLLFLGVVSVLLLALGGAILWAYRIKRAANENLEAKVRERTQELESAFRKQRELEATLQQAEKLKSIGLLAGGIAHDFNNQLGGILGFADLLREKLEDRPRLREFADTIVTLVGRSKDLTAQLLAFARKGQYQTVSLDVRDLVTEVMTLLERTVPKTIAIRHAFCSEPATVLGDPSQLQNAVLNMGINARDAMPKGGELRFDIAVEDVPAQRDATGSGGGRFVRVSVKDSGTGMDRETLKHIFEPFFTTKEVGQGTGMGLAAVFGTVQAHKGFLEVESAPGQGSEFRILLPWIPAADAKAAPLDGAERTAGRGPRHIRVLLVDDEEFIRVLAKELLESLGHVITVHPDAESALEAYRAEWRKIDLVILDMVMPGMGGKELFRRMKAVNPDIVAIVASGFSNEADAQEMLSQGLRGFISKPFSRAELAALIEDIFESVPAGQGPGPR